MRFSKYFSQQTATILGIAGFMLLCLVIFAFNHGGGAGSSGIITLNGTPPGSSTANGSAGASSGSSSAIGGSTTATGATGTVKQPTAASSAPALNAPRDQAQSDAKITVDNSGFHADAVYVASGGTVTWTNTGSEPHQIAPSLNPYATAQPLAAMHSEVLQPGQSYTFTISYDMTESGSAGYYDAKAPTHKGDIAVAKP